MRFLIRKKNTHFVHKENEGMILMWVFFFLSKESERVHHIGKIQILILKKKILAGRLRKLM